MTESTNPFLMGGFESARAENVFNPFAAPDAGNSVAAASNPFLVQGSGPENAFTQPSTYTNPFAQFLVSDPAPAPAPTPTSFFDPSPAKPTDLFCGSQPPNQNVVDLSGLILSDTPRSRKSSLAGYESDSGKRSPPRRPPPPRPNPPSVPGSKPGSVPGTPGPARETKDLILSVTGALEATSADLLDRLQATRTPSPTPLRDLASPSPTNVMEVNDLLGDDTQVPRHTHTVVHHDIQQEAMNIFDAIANLSREQENKSDTVPAPSTPPLAVATPPSRPPPPQISSQTGSPYTSRKSSLISETSRRTSVDVRETPPLPRPPLPPVIAEPEADHTLSGQQSRGSGDGARNLLASKDSPPNYVAMRKASHDITASRVPPVHTRKKYSLDYSGAMGEQTVIREQLEHYSNDFTTPTTTSNDNTDRTAPILEAPKFQVISTTPIMSYENIASENMYAEHAENEPSLIFEEATEKPASTFSASVQSSFAVSTPDPFASAAFTAPASDLFVTDMNTSSQPRDDFDDFSDKFDNVKGKATTTVTGSAFDPFGDGTAEVSAHDEGGFSADGFGNEAPFDEFLAMSQPQTDQQWPQTDYSDASSWGAYPAPPIQTAQSTPPSSFNETFNSAPKVTKTDSVETPPTPLFDEDVSQPLEPFPRTNYSGPGWEMQIRYPIRKKFTGQRFWKKVFVKLVYQGETPHIELFSRDESKETLLHEWPLQPSYAISDIGAQQYDQYGKIFTVKIQFVMYKERPGVRPGQVTKAERLTNKLSQFAAYAIQGDYQGVKEFGSDLKKLGLPVEHSPQISLICKLGSHNYEDMKQFSICVEDALFKLSAHRDNIHINYKMEEVQITAVDELYVEQNSNGSILKQIARVRLFFLGFLTGMPDVEIGVNDLWRQGKEVVGRHDIIPVVTEEWIRLEDLEFHSCLPQNVYEETRTIKFKPPDQCYLELMRFRVRPPKNRELPLQVKTVFRICGNKVDIYSDILVPGFTSRKLGQIPCEDIAVRIPIPECWIYLFRTEKHFRYGSVKSAHRRTGKIKGIERFLGAVDTPEQHLIEVTSGHAKYEHHHRAIVWRMARLPKEGQGAYTTHNLVCHLALTSYDQVPDDLAKHCFVEFTMPITQVSHFTVRSVSISNSDSDSPPEKCVRHLARHEYKIEIEQTHSESTNDYLAATMTKKPAAPPSVKPAAKQPLEPVPDTDSESE